MGLVEFVYGEIKRGYGRNMFRIRGKRLRGVVTGREWNRFYMRVGEEL
ncbi:hypothetical protein [Thermodesulfobacterium hveragerdense]|nr:hypothetical protein [Thermodesulfobacterium hveragerdense]